MSDASPAWTGPVAVIGAAGFQGRYLVEALSRASIPTLAVVRASDRRPWLDAAEGVEVREADLLDPPALRRAFEGAAAVINCAGIATPRNRDWEENRAANVDGARNVVEAAAEAGAGRLLHISTIGVYRVLPRHLRSGEPLGEDHPLLEARNRPVAGAYRVSKALGDGAVMARCRALGLPFLILRSCATFGRGDSLVMPMLDRLSRQALVPLPRGRFPVVHAGDVAAAAISALGFTGAWDRAYNLAGPPARAFGEVIRAYLKVVGRGPITFPLPPAWGLAFDSRAAEADLGFRTSPLEITLGESLSAP